MQRVLFVAYNIIYKENGSDVRIGPSGPLFYWSVYKKIVCNDSEGTRILACICENDIRMKFV